MIQHGHSLIEYSSVNVQYKRFRKAGEHATTMCLCKIVTVCIYQAQKELI